MACQINMQLSSKFLMPAVGYGTWQLKDETLETGLEVALNAGYRHIDTAYTYANEQTIGKILKKWFDEKKLTREQLFITTKLPIFGNRASDVNHYINASLSNLQLDYVDLYLIHCPFGTVSDSDSRMDYSTNIVELWKAMERLIEIGKTKSIGVSNFNKNQIERIIINSKIYPVVNQIEFHAFLQQPDLLHYLKKNNIIVTGYSTLGTSSSQQYFEDKGISLNIPNIMNNTVVKIIAESYHKTPAQVLLRHALQKNVVVIPKSTNPERIRENIDIFDFELNEIDMQALNNLNKNLRILDFKKVFKGAETHPEYPFDE